MALTKLRLILLPLFLVLGLVGVPRAAWAEVKLFLKDGTYHLAKSYEVRGDRVRYYSVERSEWEEVPVSLVDFEATKRVQQEEKASEKKELERAREIDKERFEQQADTGFEVASGIRLPKDEGVFAFDGLRVIRMVQSSGEVVRDKKRLALALALPAPLLKNRALVTLPGAKAAVRISVAQPTFFVQFADRSGAKVELISLKPSKDARVVEKVQSGIGVGKSGELRAAVPLGRAEVAPGLFKLRPTQPLPRGEYALGELLQQKLNLDVWDFGIDDAPEASPRVKSGAGTPVMSEKPPAQSPHD